MSEELKTALVVVFGLLVVASSWGNVRPYHRWWYRVLGVLIALDAIGFFYINQLELALREPAYTAFKIAVILEATALTIWLRQIHRSRLRQQWRDWHER